MARIFLIVSLLLTPQNNDRDLFYLKLARIDSDDPEALLRLGKWCEESTVPWLAVIPYKRVLKLGDGNREAYCEAAFRLAKIEFDRKDYEHAFTRLLELKGKYGHKEAGKLLRELQGNRGRRQLEYLDRGDRYSVKKDHKRALEFYKKAYDASPAKPGGADQVPRRLVLQKLAAARNALDAEYYDRKVRPVERGVHTCADCASKGFVKCRPCGGTGKVTEPRNVLERGRIVLKPMPVRHDGCGGYGYQGCGECFGLGKLSKSITREETKAVEKVLERVRKKTFKLPSLARALKVVEDELLEIRDSSSLNYLRSIRPEFDLPPPFAAVVKSAPAREKLPSEAESLWRDHSQRGQDKRPSVNLLLSYACAYARYIERFDMLRGSKKPRLPVSEPGDALSPELLAAFPDQASTDWVTVEGTLAGYEEKPGVYKGSLQIEGQIPHNVNFFVWHPDAEAHLGVLERGPWKSRLKGLRENYPFDIGDRLRSSPADHRMVMVGRFLRDRLSHPPNWFEVWDFEIGLSSPQHQMYLALGERIPDEMEFPGVPVSQLADVLRLLGLELRFEGVSQKTIVDCTTPRDCALGLLIHELAEALKVKWTYRGGEVELGRRRSREDAKDVAAVVKRLRRNHAGTIRIDVVDSGPKAPDVVELPKDPAALRVRASRAVRNMDYRTARDCFDALLEMPDVDARHVGRLRQKYFLLNELSGSTPVSRLVGASNLKRITYRLPSGGFKPMVVNVVRRDAPDWLVENDYGARFPIEVLSIVEEKDVTAAAWRREKEDELDTRAGEVIEASPRERVAKLFSLALFAKFHEFTERGAAYLEKVIAADDFPWVLDTFFAGQREQLAAVWREASGREESRPREPEVVEETPPPRAEIEPVLPTDEPLPENADELHRLARELTVVGKSCLGRTLKAEGADAGKWRRSALDHFRRAQSATDKLLEIRPGDAKAESLQRELPLLIQTAVRDLGFFE